MKVIDLSHLVTNGMPVFPGTPPVDIKPFASISSMGFNELQMLVTTHTGTHVDCPRHIINQGFDTTIEPDKFYGHALIIRCRNVQNEISPEFFRHFEEDIRKADFLLLNTEWDKKWGAGDYFHGFPVMSTESAEYISAFGIKGIGIDAPSFDAFDSEHLPVHNIFLSKGIILIENLTNLESLPDKGFDFSCLPLKIENGDGCPVRAAGIINQPTSQIKSG